MLTTRRQQQVIRDIAAGVQPQYGPDDLDYNYRIIATHISKAPSPFEALVAMKYDNEWADLIDPILSLSPGHRDQHQNLAQIGPTLPESSWLWKNWIPRGLLTLLAAYPGVGKTYFTLDLARLLISGQAPPDGESFRNLNTGHVIYVDAEDFLPEIYQRALAWQMDMTKFFPIQRPSDDLLDYAEVKYRDDLHEACLDLRPDLVIVDSLSSVNSKGENSIEDLREVLFFFIGLAKHFNCGVMLIHHLRKQSSKNGNQPMSMHDLRGSGHLVAMARCIIGMDRSYITDDPNGPRIIKSLKNNMGPAPFPIQVEFNPSESDPKIAQLDYAPMDLFSPTKTLLQQCIEWLIDLLETDGPTDYAKILEYASDEGFSRATLHRARERLGFRIIDTLGAKKTGNQWSLAPNGEGYLPIQPSITDQCANWLLETLADGPKSYSDLVAAASDLPTPFTENIIQEARKQLTLLIQDTVGPKRKGNQWDLVDYEDANIIT